MRTLHEKLVGYDDTGKAIYYKEIAGESDETKPTDGLATGSKFWEVDTGKISGFSESGNDWIEQFSLQS